MLLQSPIPFTLSLFRDRDIRGAYIMRNSNDPTIVALYQLTVYAGIPITFLVNGFLLNRVKLSTLYSFGMLLSGLSMLVMMTLNTLSVTGIGVAGILMGCSFGFFWSNRDYLALGTNRPIKQRNYYYGLETFFSRSPAYWSRLRLALSSVVQKPMVGLLAM